MQANSYTFKQTSDSRNNLLTRIQKFKIATISIEKLQEQN